MTAYFQKYWNLAWYSPSLWGHYMHCLCLTKQTYMCIVNTRSWCYHVFTVPANSWRIKDSHNTNWLHMDDLRNVIILISDYHTQRRVLCMMCIKTNSTNHSEKIIIYRQLHLFTRDAYLHTYLNSQGRYDWDSEFFKLPGEWEHLRRRARLPSNLTPKTLVH